MSDIAFGQIVFIELTLGEYRAACTCCKTFHSQVDGIEPRAESTNRVRNAVIDRLLDDGMSQEGFGGVDYHVVLRCEGMFGGVTRKPYPRNR